MSASWVPEDCFGSDQLDVRSDVYESLLAKCPVAHLDVPGMPGGYWTVFGYEDTAKVTADTNAFSNGTGRPGPKVIPLQVDPPEHRHYRKMLNQFLSAGKIAAWEPAFRALAIAMIDTMIAKGQTDIAVDFAYPFPARSLCKLLGARDEDWSLHYKFLMEMDERTQDGLLVTARAFEAVPDYIMPYLQQLVAQCRAAPGNNLVSHMIATPIDAHLLDDDALAGLTLTFMLAGWITTASGLSSLLLRIAQDAALQAMLRRNPHRIPDAIEECLRADSPVQVMPRHCTGPAEIAGHTFSAGDDVLVSYGSANLDPKFWPEPRKFDLDRANKRHVAFGRGIHQCIGAAVARAELRIAIEELLARTASITVNGPIVRRSWPRTSVDNLPVTLVSTHAVVTAAG